MARYRRGGGRLRAPLAAWLALHLLLLRAAALPAPVPPLTASPQPAGAAGRPAGAPAASRPRQGLPSRPRQSCPALSAPLSAPGCPCTIHYHSALAGGGDSGANTTAAGANSTAGGPQQLNRCPAGFRCSPSAAAVIMAVGWRAPPSVNTTAAGLDDSLAIATGWDWTWGAGTGAGVLDDDGGPGGMATAAASSGVCVPCQLTEYCPAGTEEETWLSIVECQTRLGQAAPSGGADKAPAEPLLSEQGTMTWCRGFKACPRGRFCPSPSVAQPCVAGSWCPEGMLRPQTCNVTRLLSWDPFKVVRPDPTSLLERLAAYGVPLGGNSCPANSTTPLTPCPPGFFCPTEAELIECPAGHACPSYSSAPVKCPPLASCTAPGAAAPAWSWWGLLLLLLCLVLLLALLEYLRVAGRRSGRASEDEVAQLIGAVGFQLISTQQEQYVLRRIAPPAAPPKRAQLTAALQRAFSRVPPGAVRPRSEDGMSSVRGSLRSSVTALSRRQTMSTPHSKGFAEALRSSFVAGVSGAVSISRSLVWRASGGSSSTAGSAAALRRGAGADAAGRPLAEGREERSQLDQQGPQQEQQEQPPPPPPHTVLEVGSVRDAGAAAAAPGAGLAAGAADGGGAGAKRPRISWARSALEREAAAAAAVADDDSDAAAGQPRRLERALTSDSHLTALTGTTNTLTDTHTTATDKGDAVPAAAALPGAAMDEEAPRLTLVFRDVWVADRPLRGRWLAAACGLRRAQGVPQLRSPSETGAWDGAPGPDAAAAEAAGAAFIVPGVSGEFRHSQLHAIMGPSGCGKTTLLKALAGRLPAARAWGDVRAVLCAQGAAGADARGGGAAPQGELSLAASAVAHMTGFVPQFDLLHESLTVAENLTVAARLRLPHGAGRRGLIGACRDCGGGALRARLRARAREVSAAVDEVVARMALTSVAHQVVGASSARLMSGGQRKRAAIGVELVAAPRLLYLDEPTSGLDAAVAADVVSALKGSAQGGVTVVAVMHQPRCSIFNAFDTCLLLGSEGHVVYAGPQVAALPYCAYLGFAPPPGESAADFLLDVTAGVVSRPGDPDFIPSELAVLWLRCGDIWVARHAAAPPEAQRTALARLLVAAQRGDAPPPVDWPWRPRDLQALRARFKLLTAAAPAHGGAGALPPAALAGESGGGGGSNGAGPSVLTYAGFLRFWDEAGLRAWLSEAQYQAFVSGLCADFGIAPGGVISQADFIAVLKRHMHAAAAVAAGLAHPGAHGAGESPTGGGGGSGSGGGAGGDVPEPELPPLAEQLTGGRSAFEVQLRQRASSADEASPLEPLPLSPSAAPAPPGLAAAPAPPPGARRCGPGAPQLPAAGTAPELGGDAARRQQQRAAAVEVLERFSKTAPPHHLRAASMIMQHAPVMRRFATRAQSMVQAHAPRPGAASRASSSSALGDDERAGAPALEGRASLQEAKTLRDLGDQIMLEHLQQQLQLAAQHSAGAPAAPPEGEAPQRGGGDDAGPGADQAPWLPHGEQLSEELRVATRELSYLRTGTAPPGLPGGAAARGAAPRWVAAPGEPAAAAAAVAATRRRLPSTAEQLAVMLGRCGRKWISSRGALMTDLLLTALLGLALGTAQGHIDNAGESVLWGLITLLAFGTMALARSTHSLGDERHLFLQSEAHGGVSALAWVLGHVLFDLLGLLLQPLVFFSSLYVLTLPLVPPRAYLSVLVLVGWYCSGVGYLVSLATPPRQALVAGLAIALLLGGVANGVAPKVWQLAPTNPLAWLDAISYTRWGLQALYIAWLTPRLSPERAPATAAFLAQLGFCGLDPRLLQALEDPSHAGDRARTMGRVVHDAAAQRNATSAAADAQRWLGMGGSAARADVLADAAAAAHAGAADDDARAVTAAAAALTQLWRFQSHPEALTQECGGARAAALGVLFALGLGCRLAVVLLVKWKVARKAQE
ncbi:ABCG21 [Scenedesmus sp. PABB004]|nr:ABCG21 [Scenedesmus sp. PABB004]